MDKIKLKSMVVDCNGVSTQIISAGEQPVLETSQEYTSDFQDIILIIPGNPGVATFYEGFVTALKLKLGEETPVWVISHAGHFQINGSYYYGEKTYDKTDDKFNLDGQIKQKVDFIKNYVPKNARLHLVGHSIGCWFILQLLKHEFIANQTRKCYLLFPTIEHMVSTPNGVFLTKFVLKNASLLVFLSWIFSFFPKILRLLLILTFGSFFGVTKKTLKAVDELINPYVLKKVFYLAQDEMKRVNELDSQVVSKYLDKIWLYYGSIDGWVPVSYFNRLKEKFPTINAELCEKGYYHAFVLHHDREIANIVGNSINQTISS